MRYTGNSGILHERRTIEGYCELIILDKSAYPKSYCYLIISMYSKAQRRSTREGCCQYCKNDWQPNWCRVKARSWDFAGYDGGSRRFVFEYDSQ